MWYSGSTKESAYVGSFFIWAFKLEFPSGLASCRSSCAHSGKVVRMMPRGSNPNSVKNLSKGKPFCEESARKAAKKKHEKEAVFKSLNEDLRERLTPELIAEINQRIISLAKSGNLKAYELIRNGIGEDPAKKVELSGTDGGPLEFVWVGEDDTGGDSL